MKIKLNEVEYEYTRPPLKKWLAIEDMQAKLREAVEIHKTESVAKHLVSVVSTALSIPEEEIKERPWYEIGVAYLSINVINIIKYDFPFLNSKVKDKKEVWDYEGRTWYIWAHMLANRYGWNLETIAELDVDDAIALAQEIAVEDQLDKEWRWMTTEIAYQTKDGFKPLQRPDWMLYSKGQQIIPIVKIRKDFMPSGVVIRYPTSPNN